MFHVVSPPTQSIIAVGKILGQSCPTWNDEDMDMGFDDDDDDEELTDESKRGES